MKAERRALAKRWKKLATNWEVIKAWTGYTGSLMGEDGNRVERKMRELEASDEL